MPANEPENRADLMVGDVVRLTCAAVRMTVDKRDPGNPEGEWACVWFDESGILQRACFHEPQLIVLKRQGE